MWELLLAILTVLSVPFRDPEAPNQPYDATPWGPQSWEEATIARNALHNEDGDIRYPEEYDPSYAGINGTQYRWPGFPGAGKIPYVLSPEVAQDQDLVDLINDAIKQIQDNTCITIFPRTTETSYVNIKKDPGYCYSHVGVIDSSFQPQPMSLDDGCKFIGTVVHEFGHAIGLFHEHQRSDRDNFLNVYEQNVKADAISNFNKTEAIDELTFNKKYDYTSIMHYGTYAFSKDPGNLKTMEAKDGTELKEPYDRSGLNQNDIDLIKKLYKCK